MHKYIIPLILSIIISCNADKKPPKKYLLTKDQIIPVLVDIHLVFGVQAMPEYRELADIYDSVNIHSRIFEKYHIEKAVLDSSLAYYSKNPEELIEIYDEVLMRLTQLQDSIKQYE